MRKKRTFPLRIDADLMAALEKWAADEFRSVNGQIEWIVHQSLHKAKRLKSVRREEKSEGDTNNEK